MRLTRNVMNHFSKAGIQKDISRTAFKTPFSHTTTFNSGKLVPFFFQECVPGDTVQIDATGMVARMQTPLVPVMGTAMLDYWYFFVPNRLVWDNFKEFMGENTKGPWSNNLPARLIPIINTSDPQNHITSGSSADYLGLPLGSFGAISALPFRGIRQIWNDWFRSTAVDDPLLVNKGDAEPRYSVGPQNFDLLPVNKFPDYFTTALPSPQYGEPVSIGLGTLADVFADDSLISADLLEKTNSLLWRDVFNTPEDNSYYGYTLKAYPSATSNTEFDTVSNSPDEFDTYERRFKPVNLKADLRNAGVITVNDLRVAFQIQKYKETQARGGSRYTEILESIWSVSSPDSRLQRTEYIGGDRALVSMSQVIQNSSSVENSPLGNAAGFSKTSTRGGAVTYAVPEHGFVIGLLAVRPIHTYQQGIDRYWKKREVFDFYNPLLANIGETPVFAYELYATQANATSSNPDIFGYQEAWADYRYKRSYVSGEMRSGIQNSLDIYHYGDYYATQPTLSPGWLHEDPALIDRTISVSSDVANQFICDIYIDLTMIRPMPAYSIPGLIDHA